MIRIGHITPEQFYECYKRFDRDLWLLLILPYSRGRSLTERLELYINVDVMFVEVLDELNIEWELED